MILIETFVEVLKMIARLFVWLITTRDCEHCEWGYKNLWGDFRCARIAAEKEECLNTVCRNKFERKKKKRK